MRLAVSATLVGLLVALTPKAKSRYDERAVVRVLVGRPKAFAAMERLGPGRELRSATALPVDLQLIWKVDLSGNIELDPVVDGRGNVIVAHAASFLSQLSPKGKVAWSVELASAPVTSPVLSSSELRIVLDASGKIDGFTPTGHLALETELPMARGARPIAPLSLDQGGVILGLGDDLFELDGSGNVVSSASVEGAVSLLGDRTSILILNDKGTLYRWPPPLDPSPVGNLGAPPSAEPVLLGKHLFCLAGGRLRSLDVETGATQVLRDNDVNARTLLAVGVAPAYVASLGRDGSLVGTAQAGGELFRHVWNDGTAPTVAEWGTPIGISDELGTILFASGTTLATRDAQGKIRAASSPCATPVAVVPIGARRVVLVCASGTVAAFSDTAPKTSN